jgi:hypothetical protein
LTRATEFFNEFFYVAAFAGVSAYLPKLGRPGMETSEELLESSRAPEPMAWGEARAWHSSVRRGVSFRLASEPPIEELHRREQGRLCKLSAPDDPQSPLG